MILPAKVRKVIYIIVTVASAIVAVPDLVPAPIAAKIVAVVAALSSVLAALNVTPADEPVLDV